MKCDFGEKDDETVIRYRQRTFYENEEDNFVNACPEDKKMNDERWNQQWAEIYDYVLSDK